MTPNSKCLMEPKRSEMLVASHVLRRALKNRHTATNLYAAAALKWLQQDVPDTVAAAASLQAMLDEVRSMNAIIGQMEIDGPDEKPVKLIS